MSVFVTNNDEVEGLFWQEINPKLWGDWDIQAHAYRTELLLNPNNFEIYFFGVKAKLIAQEYKFLKSILKRGGEKISAYQLMSQINSKCQSEKRQNFSYRIKSKIKAKIKKSFLQQYPNSCVPLPCELGGWSLIDYEYCNPRETDCKIITGNPNHYFDFDKYFDFLISVKAGYYFTTFICEDNVNIDLKSKSM